MCRLFEPGLFQAAVSCHAEVRTLSGYPMHPLRKREPSNPLLLDAVTFVIVFSSLP